MNQHCYGLACQYWQSTRFWVLSYFPVRDVLDNYIEKTTRGTYRWTCWTHKCKGDQHHANTAINVNIVLVRGGVIRDWDHCNLTHNPRSLRYFYNEMQSFKYKIEIFKQQAILKSK